MSAFLLVFNVALSDIHFVCNFLRIGISHFLLFASYEIEKQRFPLITIFILDFKFGAISSN